MCIRDLGIPEFVIRDIGIQDFGIWEIVIWVFGIWVICIQVFEFRHLGMNRYAEFISTLSLHCQMVEVVKVS